MIRAYDGYGGQFTAETEYESGANHEIEKSVRLVRAKAKARAA